MIDGHVQALDSDLLWTPVFRVPTLVGLSSSEKEPN